MSETIRFFASLNAPSSGGNEEAGEVCIANISLPERQMRMRFSIVQLCVTLVILAAMIFFNIHPAWRLLLIFMFWASTAAYFEARDKTCIALALKDSRKMSEVEEKIENEAELKQIHRQSRKLMFKAFLTALTFTLIAYVLP